MIRSDGEVGSLPSLKDPPGGEQQLNNQQARPSGRKSKKRAEGPKIAVFRFSTKLDQLHRKSEKRSDFRNRSRKFSKNKEKNRKNL